MTEKCESCKYWKLRFKDSMIHGWCYRFPDRLDKVCDDWCGEYHSLEG